MIRPILFNTDMVQAILDGGKTATRRVMKGYALEHLEIDTDGSIIGVYDQFEGCVRPVLDFAPYRPGDILYVRETWRIQSAHRFEADARIEFKAGGPMKTIQFPGYKSKGIDRTEYDAFLLKWDRSGWIPSIHMPKRAARLFLRVTDVSAERLQDMTEEDAFNEGYNGKPWCEHLVYENYPDSPIPCYAAGSIECPSDPPCDHSIPELFGIEIWDKTIKPAELEVYGWKANPWVWTANFERINGNSLYDERG